MCLTTLEGLLILVGFLTAALSGVAGLGGGTILIGALFAFGLAPIEAVPLFAAVQFVSNSARTLAYVGHVEWRGTGWFALAAVPAIFLLAPYAGLANADWVRLLLAGLILVSLLPTRGGGAPLPARESFILAGVLNGGLGNFVGATGLYVGRLFLRPEWSKETTIGTLAFTQTLGHGLRALAMGVAGYSAFANPGLLGGLCVAVVAGTWVGKQLNRRLSEAHFASLFKCLLVVLSCKLIIDSSRGFGWI